MTGHELEHFDSAQEAEALPYGAYQFAELGHHALSGGDVIIEAHKTVTPAESQSALQQKFQPKVRQPAPSGEHTFARPKVIPLGFGGMQKPGIVY
jgi:hypothetical protein